MEPRNCTDSTSANLQEIRRKGRGAEVSATDAAQSPCRPWEEKENYCSSLKILD